MDKDLTTTNILHVDDFVEKVSKEVTGAVNNCKDASRLINRVSVLAQLKFKLGDRILLLINHILKPHGHELALKSENDADEELCNAFDNIVDDFGRKIDNYLQEAQGKKVKEDDSIIKTKEADASKKNKSDQSESLLANVAKPQTFFKIKVDNSSTPFVPLIFEKPNALKPLEDSLSKDKDGDFYPHPYQFELDHFEPSEDLLMKVEPQPPRDLRNTPLTFVDTEEKLDRLILKLRNVNEIAVDLEHHNLRSYLGFTCLMQISTRQEDFIVDAIAIRHVMQKFNAIFTDPAIVKVLHGSDFDVVWLQKDFGVYLVNTFDTGLAARTLKFPYFSYAYVLKRYCRVDANKMFQLADWRVRPLKEDMVRYAREDTHYLLYIYDMMRNELIDQNNGFDGLLRIVIQNSTDLCKKRYEKPYLREDACYDTLKDSGFVPSGKQLELLKKLYQWRDGMAREQDESTGFILPNKKLITILKTMPKDIAGVVACLDQSRFGIAESVHRIITSVMSETEDEREVVKGLEKTVATPNTPISGHEKTSMFDMRKINRADFLGEDLILKALKNISVIETPPKPLSEKQVVQKQPSKLALAMEIKNRIRNPFIMFWPESFVLESGCKDDQKITFKMKAHTVKKSNTQVTACPEVIETKPVMLLDESSTDKLLKTIRAQIREKEAPKRKAEEEEEAAAAAGQKRKKNRTEAAAAQKGDENQQQIESHQYDEQEWQKMFKGEPESKDNKRPPKNNKRKSNDMQSNVHKKPRMPTKSFSFLPKDGKNSQTPGKPLPSAPRIPWPGKK